MEKFILTKPELMILMLNLQASMKGERVCLCDKSDICFVCETVKVLKRISRETGVPITLPNIRKPVREGSFTVKQMDGFVEIAGVKSQQEL